MTAVASSPAANPQIFASFIGDRGGDGQAIADVDPDTRGRATFANLDNRVFGLIARTEFHRCFSLVNRTSGKVEARQTDREPSASRCLHLDLAAVLKGGVWQWRILTACRPESRKRRPLRNSASGSPCGRPSRSPKTFAPPVIRLTPRSAARDRLCDRHCGRSARQDRWRVPEDTHPPILYPAALTADSKDPAAARLLEFRTSPAARPLFEKGFSVLH